MKFIHSLCLLIIFALISILNSIQAQQNLESIMNLYDFELKQVNKGVSILIKKNGLIETVGIGNFNLSEKSVFNIGSATKTFTAILILQEEEKGTIKITDSIGNYLSPIKNVDGSLTIESLLRHESGLGEIVGRDTKTYFYSKNDSIYGKNIIDTFPDNTPSNVGSYSYCNGNYILLGKILEKITDQSYFDLIRERILAPLNMHDSYPYLHKNIPNLAPPLDENKDVSDVLDHRYFANYAYAAGSIASTLLDMEKFYTALFETEVLLKKETLTRMLPSKNSTYGLGIMSYTYNSKIYYGHGGNNIGYAFRNAYNPKTKNLVLFFSNTRRIPFRSAINENLIGYLHNKPIAQKLKLDITRDFQDFIGKYVLDQVNVELEIISEQHQMFMLIQGQKVLLAYQDQNTLYDVNVGVRLQRIKGNSNALMFQQNDFKAKLRRKSENTSNKKLLKK